MKSTSLLGTALLLASVCHSASALEAFEARFAVSRNNKPLGTMDMRLTAPAPGQWLFVSRTEGKKGLAGFLGVSIEERSQLIESEQGLTAQNYSYQQDMLGRHRKRQLTVDANGAVAEDDGDKSWKYTLVRPVFDKHAVVLGIAERLAHEVDAGSVFDLPVASKGRIESWRFLVVAEEQIDTPKGTITAVRVERMRDNADRKTISWHAPSMGYLPIKVEQTEPDGERLSSLLQSYSGR